jgi:excisionase family DNA binding protein
MRERLTLTVPEAARLLGVSRGVAYEAARTGDLPVVKLGRRLVVPRARLTALLGEDAPTNGNGGNGCTPPDLESVWRSAGNEVRWKGRAA